MTVPSIRHAGCLALRRGGAWRGALIEGASAIGKSDLALRAMEHGFRLVADDRTLVFASGGRLFGRAPRPLAGLLEVRGLGVVTASALTFAEIVLVARCHGLGAAERLPEFAPEAICGVELPVFALCPLEASAPARLRAALEHLGERRQQGYQAPPRPCRGV